MQRTQRYDLNLLIVLEALLQTNSVSAAAERLGISVPAASRALFRIRKTFNDPIFVRSGRSLVPTSRAQQLREDISGLLEQARKLIHDAPTQDIRSAERTFRVRCSEVIAGALAAPLFERISAEAPRVHLEFVAEESLPLDSLRSAHADMDIGGDPQLPSEIKIRRIASQELVALVRNGHPLLQRRMTAKAFTRYPHVSTQIQQIKFDEVDVALAQLQLKRRVAIVVPSFHAAAMTLLSTDCIATMPGLFAASFRQHLPVKPFTIPLKLPSVDARIAWHPRLDRDPAHAWLRQAAAEILQSLLPLA